MPTPTPTIPNATLRVSVARRGEKGGIVFSGVALKLALSWRSFDQSTVLERRR
jgi:hypothetical protein